MSIKNIIGSVLAIAAFGSFAMAQGGQPNQPPRERGDSAPGRGMDAGSRGFGNRGARMMRQRRMMNFNRLNLTDAQKQRVQALQETQRRTRESSQAQFAEMGRLMQFKREGLLTTEQGTRLTALEAQMKTNMEKTQAELLAILTPEQKTLLGQMQNGRRNGGGPGEMRGDGGRRRQMQRNNRRPGRPGAPAGMPNQPSPQN